MNLTCSCYKIQSLRTSVLTRENRSTSQPFTGQTTCLFSSTSKAVYLKSHREHRSIVSAHTLIIAPYIKDNTLVCKKPGWSPEADCRVDKWPSKEFECADEWSWWSHRTIIKHCVSSNAVTIASVCQVRCSLARLSVFQSNIWTPVWFVGVNKSSEWAASPQAAFSI